MITSRQNAKLKNIRRIRRCKGDRLVLEGPHLVREALAAGLVLETVLATPGFLITPEGELLCSRLQPPPIEVAPALLAELTDADSPRGILAVARLPRLGVEHLPRVDGGVYLYVEGIQDPGNLGALARTAEASGAVGLALSPATVHPNHPRALRGSAGSLLRMPVATDVAPEGLDRHLAALSPCWVALIAHGGQDLYQAPAEGTLVLAVGTEGGGLSAALQRRAELRLTIPLEAPVESLNVTVAVAVVLFELRRRRGSVG